MSVNRENKYMIHLKLSCARSLLFTVFLSALTHTDSNSKDQNPKPLLIETQRCYKLRLLFLPPSLPLALAQLLHITPAVQSSLPACSQTFLAV